MWNHGNFNDSWWCNPGGFLPGPGGFFITLLFWGVVIYLAVKLFQFLTGTGRSAATCSEESNSPIEVLKRRYAKGEVSKDEFNHIRQNMVRG